MHGIPSLLVTPRPHSGQSEALNQAVLIPRQLVTPLDACAQSNALHSGQLRLPRNRSICCLTLTRMQTVVWHSQALACTYMAITG